MRTYDASVRPAARSWAEALDEWAIPDEILAAAPEPPWGFLPRMFEPSAMPEDTPSRRRALDFLAVPGSVLDVGCGAGAASLALVPAVTEVVGVDESAVMLDRFAAAASAARLPFRTALGTWPAVAGDVPVVDVAVSHHVLYNVRDLVAFVVALTGHARRGVVVELSAKHPLSYLGPLWKHFWGLRRPDGPSATDALAVVREAGIDPVVDRRPRRKGHERSNDDLVHLARKRLCLPPDRDAEVAAQLERLPPVVDEVWTFSWPGDA